MLPVAIKRDGGDSGNYEGSSGDDTDSGNLYLWSTCQDSCNVIRQWSWVIYLSSTASNPNANGYSGTWVAKGTATDTKQEVSAVSYTREDNQTIQETFEGNYSRDFVATDNRGFVAIHSRAFAGDYVAAFTGDYTRTFVGDYVPNYIGDYTRDFVGNYSRAFTRYSQRTRVSNYNKELN